MKARRKLTVFLIVYIIISVIVGLSAFKYLAPKFVSANTVIGIYALISIGVALYVISQLKNLIVTTGGTGSTAADYFADQDQKERERKEQEKIDKELKRRRTEENQKHIVEKVDEIVEGLDAENDVGTYFDKLLISLSKSIMIVQGVAYILNKETQKYSIISTFAYYTTDTSRTFTLGEGIPGQVAKDQKLLFLDGVPEGYIKVVSGLGSSSPKYMGVIPFIHDGVTIAIIEIATFEKPEIDFDAFHKQFNSKVSDKMASLIK
jgi:hypothetical protein